MLRTFSKRQTKRWMKSIDRRMASAAAIITDIDDKLLIVKADYKDYWTLPGGIIDVNESPRMAALREVEEEVGIVLSLDELTFLWVTDRRGKRFSSYQFVFGARIHQKADEITLFLQANEIEDAEWVTKAEVLSVNRHYGKAIERWANEESAHYVEQTFDE